MGRQPACSCAAGAFSLRRQRGALVTVLAINAAMFAIEAGAGWSAQSVSLQADALDFLGDSINYAIALFVLTRSISWRAGTAFAKGLVMIAFGAGLVIVTIVHALTGAAPQAPLMGGVGMLALLANLVSAFVLFRFRKGDANLRAVWLCSRNDAIGNLAVVGAASGVFLSGTMWPDLAVGLGMAVLAAWAGISVVRHALAELRAPRMAGE